MPARLIVGLLIVMLAPVQTFAQSVSRRNEDILAQAQAAFQLGVENKARFLLARKHFSEAANLYRELHRRGVRSPALYRNLGNAALLADHWPEAIWAYHLGLKLDPNDEFMRSHLAFARAKVLYPPSGEGRLDVDTWPAWLHRPTLFELFGVFVIAYFSAWLAGSLALLAHRTGLGHVGRRLLIASIALLVAGGGGAALWHAQQQADIDRRTPLVVIAENAPFYRGNATSYPRHAALPMLPRGLEARQIHRRGNWMQIRLSTGEVGWLSRREVFVVEP